MTNFNGYTSRAQVIRDLRAKGFTFSTALGATESNPKLAKGAKLGVLSKPHNLAPGKESGKWNLCSSASPGCLIACLKYRRESYLPSRQIIGTDSTDTCVYDNAQGLYRLNGI